MDQSRLNEELRTIRRENFKSLLMKILTGCFFILAVGVTVFGLLFVLMVLI